MRLASMNPIVSFLSPSSSIAAGNAATAISAALVTAASGAVVWSLKLAVGGKAALLSTLVNALENRPATSRKSLSRRERKAKSRTVEDDSSSLSESDDDRRADSPRPVVVYHERDRGRGRRRRGRSPIPVQFAPARQAVPRLEDMPTIRILGHGENGSGSSSVRSRARVREVVDVDFLPPLPSGPMSDHRVSRRLTYVGA